MSNGSKPDNLLNRISFFGAQFQKQHPITSILLRSKHSPLFRGGLSRLVSPLKSLGQSQHFSDRVRVRVLDLLNKKVYDLNLPMALGKGIPKEWLSHSLEAYLRHKLKNVDRAIFSRSCRVLHPMHSQALTDLGLSKSQLYLFAPFFAGLFEILA